MGGVKGGCFIFYGVRDGFTVKSSGSLNVVSIRLRTGRGYVLYFFCIWTIFMRVVL